MLINWILWDKRDWIQWPVIFSIYNFPKLTYLLVLGSLCRRARGGLWTQRWGGSWWSWGTASSSSPFSCLSLLEQVCLEQAQLLNKVISSGLSTAVGDETGLAGQWPFAQNHQLMKLQKWVVFSQRPCGGSDGLSMSGQDCLCIVQHVLWSLSNTTHGLVPAPGFESTLKHQLASLWRPWWPPPCYL